jgi:ribonuclease VapC
MVIDTSAIVAILFDEPDHRLYGEAIEAAGVRLVSAVTRVELSFVIEGRKRDAGRERLERFFRLTGAEIVAVTPQQAETAIGAFRRFGRGRHPAAFNIGDCFSYALTIAADDTLLFKGGLFKGGDSARTDIRSALPPAASP